VILQYYNNDLRLLFTYGIVLQALLLRM